jgi:hypothetical protein
VHLTACLHVCSVRFRTLLVLFSLSGFALAAHAAVPADTSTVTVATGREFRGWRDAIVLRNAVVEVIVVPSVGRVMQFRFAGENDGPFWVNDKLAGQSMPAEPWRANPGSFGGDKTWPAPQSLWNWPPPAAFDAAPLTATVNSDRSVSLESPVATAFGLRAVRRIVLDPTEPVLRIETTYEKISGAPLPVSVWVITQVRDPVAVFVPLPATSIFPNGLAPRWPEPADFVSRAGALLRMTRDRRTSHKIGSDASTLVWAGERELLRIDLPRVAGAAYPDGGCSVEVYTNPDPAPYVELETFGPLKTLNAGDRLTATNTYRLAHRTAAGLEADVRALLAP